MDLKSVEAVMDSKIFDKIIYLVIFLLGVGVAITSHYNNKFFSVILGMFSLLIILLVLIKILRRMTCNPNKPNGLIYQLSKNILLVTILLFIFIEILIMRVIIIKLIL